jgi:hypothetical protein
LQKSSPILMPSNMGFQYGRFLVSHTVPILRPTIWQSPILITYWNQIESSQNGSIPY